MDAVVGLATFQFDDEVKKCKKTPDFEITLPFDKIMSEQEKGEFIKLKKITKAEFMALSKKEENYFQNGVIFDWINDNVIAFENVEDENFTYWEVQR